MYLFAASSLLFAAIIPYLSVENESIAHNCNKMKLECYLSRLYFRSCIYYNGCSFSQKEILRRL